LLEQQYVIVYIIKNHGMVPPQQAYTNTPYY